MDFLLDVFLPGVIAIGFGMAVALVPPVAAGVGAIAMWRWLQRK